MRILLDTHALVWVEEGSGHLGKRATKLLLAPAHQLFLSPITALELARLAALGRIRLAKPLSEWLTAAVGHLALLTAPFGLPEALGSYELPGEFHRDPADRMLVATARVNQLTLLTADERILRYPHVKSIDARN